VFDEFSFCKHFTTRRHTISAIQIQIVCRGQMFFTLSTDRPCPVQIVSRVFPKQKIVYTAFDTTLVADFNSPNTCPFIYTYVLLLCCTTCVYLHLRTFVRCNKHEISRELLFNESVRKNRQVGLTKL